MTRARKVRATPTQPHAVQHFEDGLVAIVGETAARRVSLAIIGSGNPGGTLRVHGSAKALRQLAKKIELVCWAAAAPLRGPRHVMDLPAMRLLLQRLVERNDSKATIARMVRGWRRDLAAAVKKRRAR